MAWSLSTLSPACRQITANCIMQDRLLRRWCCGSYRRADSKTGYWTAGKAAEEIRIAVVNEVVELLTGEYTLQPMNRILQPKDIAILVRTNTQAREYQAALRLAGVPSVLNSTESVFASQEAADLYSLLQAVAHPGDSGLLKQALTLDWFDLDGQTLYQLINNETELDAWMSRFLELFSELATNRFDGDDAAFAYARKKSGPVYPKH